MKRDNNILIVSEDEPLRHRIINDLAIRGVPAIEARNAVMGMAALTQTYPALILLDALMSGMNGIQFCRQMVQYELTSVPVMIMFEPSQKAMIIRDLSVLRIAQKGAIQKPFSTDELVGHIEKLLGFLPQGAVSPPPQAGTLRQPAASPPESHRAESSLREVDELLKPRPRPAAPVVSEKDAGLAVQSRLDHRAAPAKSSAQAASPSKSPARKTGYRVLVIDDDSDIRLFLKLSLSEQYEVGAAENGMVGLAMMEQFLPDIIICDILMPVMNGLETGDAIRKHPKFKDIPVFFLTGEKHPELPERAKQAGGSLFLPKPIDPARLIHYIEHFIRELKLSPRSREVTVSDHYVGQQGPVRILIIDSIPDNFSKLKAVLNENPHGQWETIWSEEPRVALASLGRTQADLILYNPRQRVMEGSAFAQFLSFKKMADTCELAFTGREFSNEDLEYSRDHLGREPVRLDVPESDLRTSLMDLIGAGRAKFKAKKYTLDQLHAQETAASTATRSVADPEEARRNREMMREQYKRIQRYIDSDE